MGAQKSLLHRFDGHGRRSERVFVRGELDRFANSKLALQLLDQPLSAYWRLAQSPCCLNEIDIAAGKIFVQRVNETGYLEALKR